MYIDTEEEKKGCVQTSKEKVGDAGRRATEGGGGAGGTRNCATGGRVEREERRGKAGCGA